jgi:sulfur-oxidizing protein SoxX
MKITTIALSLGAVAILGGCAASYSSAELDKMTSAMINSSFKAKGIAGIDRLNQDEINLACSAAETSGKDLDSVTRKRVEEANMKTIKWPSDGNYFGDWKRGEAVAQSGRGSTYSDKAGAPNGGNCYNCHQISKAELSYGTLGPSLYNYGKLRGNSEAVVKYTWGKIYNAKAYNACTNMPRFGHTNVLTEVQMRDLMALLLDPKSPINQ